MSRQIIAIDGIDGSGKTRFAARLEAACKTRSLPVELLRIDDFRCPVDWQSAGDEVEVYYSRYYDLSAVDGCLSDFTAGAASHQVPTFDPISEAITGARTLEFADDEILILEGVFTLRVPAAQNATLIYLATSYDEARRRIMIRDMAKNRTAAEVERRIEQRYFPTQRRYHHDYDPRGRAHVVIDNENPAQPDASHVDLDALPATLVEAIRSTLPAKHEPGR